jgi:hypothetical protein
VIITALRLLAQAVEHLPSKHVSPEFNPPKKKRLTIIDVVI